MFRALSEIAGLADDCALVGRGAAAARRLVPRRSAREQRNSDRSHDGSFFQFAVGSRNRIGPTVNGGEMPPLLELDRTRDENELIWSNGWTAGRSASADGHDFTPLLCRVARNERVALGTGSCSSACRYIPKRIELECHLEFRPISAVDSAGRRASDPSNAR